MCQGIWADLLTVRCFTVERIPGTLFTGVEGDANYPVAFEKGFPKTYQGNSGSGVPSKGNGFLLIFARRPHSLSKRSVDSDESVLRRALFSRAKRYVGLGSYRSLLMMRSIALFSIIPLPHHSIIPFFQKNSGMTDNLHKPPLGADQGNVLPRIAGSSMGVDSSLV